MKNKDTDFEDILKETALEPPAGFTARVMVSVGETEQLPASKEGMHLVLGLKGSQAHAAEHDYSMSMGESIKIQLSTHPMAARIAGFFKWSAVAVSGALGVEQVAAFIAGAWTATAAF